MLRKSPPVMRTHSCGRRAPIGCIARNPGMTRSTIEACVSLASIRGSVSYVAVSGGGRGWSTSHVQRHPHLGIFGEEVEEDRRAGAPLTDDHDRRDDVARGDLGLGRGGGDDAEPRRQVAEQFPLDDGRAEVVQRGFAVEGVDQAVETLLPLVAAEVVVAGGLDGLRGDPLSIEAPHRRASFHSAGRLHQSGQSMRRSPSVSGRGHPPRRASGREVGGGRPPGHSDRPCGRAPFERCAKRIAIRAGPRAGSCDDPLVRIVRPAAFRGQAEVLGRRTRSPSGATERQACLIRTAR